MAYVLKFDNCDDAMSFKNKFNELLPTSRFKCELRSDYRPKISLHNIRLKESKPYCGNHPGSCKVVEKKKKGNFLEGADWVGLNDMLNDILDSLDMSANVSSVACVVRQGKERCVAYRQDWQGEWEYYGEYENHCLQDPPETLFPPGTPGIPEWKANADNKCHTADA